MKIGFIGQGYVGKNTANDFENRGFEVVRYSLESEYIANKELIASCDVVFIAVPTPTTPEGFDFSIITESLSLVGEGKIVVIKSTLLPGTTEKLQEMYPHLIILFSPEFLCEATAAQDAAHPIFNIIGTSIENELQSTCAKKVLTLLPHSERVFVTTAKAAELFKYAHNIQGYMRVILSNLFYDTSTALGVEWKDIQQMMNVDPMMSPYYNAPVHKSGRGAGGHCFIKDMAAFKLLYKELLPNDALGTSIFEALEKKNLELLASTGKDQELVRGVYGPQ